MKKIAIAVALFLGMAVAGHAQAPPPADSFEGGWHIAVNGGYTNLSNQTTNNGFLTSVAVRVAKHWNARLDYFQTASPAAKIIVAGPEYNFSLAHVLPKSSFIDVTKIEAFGNVRAGASHLEPCGSLAGAELSACKAAKETPGPAFKFAVAVGGGINYRVNAMLTVRPLEVSYVHSAAGSQFIGNHVQFASGIGLRF